MSGNLLQILTGWTDNKLNSYSEELIHPLGKIVCQVNYKGQLCHHSFIIVDGKRPDLLGKDMLRVIKINFSNYIFKSQIYNVNSTILLDDILEKYSKVFDSELGKMEDVLVKLLHLLRLNLYFVKLGQYHKLLKKKLRMNYVCLRRVLNL